MIRIVVISSALLFVGVGVFVWTQSNPATLHTPQLTSPTENIANVSTQLVRAQDIQQAAPQFIFSARIPAGWRAEAVPQIQAISFYDPTRSEDSSLEQSEIFIRSFSAADFLTLSTVTIYSQESLVVAGRPAIQYDIEKKSNVPNFASQPSWRSRRHIVTDVRVSDSDPSVFYVIAKRPDLDGDIYEQVLQSLVVDTTSQ